ncbi:hypothetical protein WN51_12832 [Melipona quadrifasciata]|uniref:Uncharacterized protein n=1 Tax=Melipona quadrifasciata TaxID=166423 RepID=A0A0N0U5Y5_9HYME|nr:hypothetical protein WN51_12832 [Melipona quadrifasciata]
MIMNYKKYFVKIYPTVHIGVHLQNNIKIIIDRYSLLYFVVVYEHCLFIFVILISPPSPSSSPLPPPPPPPPPSSSS